VRSNGGKFHKRENISKRMLVNTDIETFVGLFIVLMQF
jgi:hypothetical protein